MIGLGRVRAKDLVMGATAGAFLGACGGPTNDTVAAHDAGTGGDDSSPKVIDAGAVPDATSAPADSGGGADASPAPPSVDGGSVDGAAGGTTATLNFTSAGTYSLYASVGGGTPHIVQLDTGSIGLYVPRSVVGAGAQISTTQTCSITYVSSGNTLSGHTATAAVALLGSKSAGDLPSPPTTVPMSLCAVDDPSFTGGMMGVGFGRGTTLDPSRNVLLEMADVKSGAMRAGYILSTHPAPHVQIGVSAATTAGFQTVPLTPDPAGSGDWLASSLRGCLSVPSAPSFGQPCGGLLVDTGVPECLLWGPSDATLGGTIPSGAMAVPNGVALKITAAAGAAVLAYGFVVGTGSDTPSAVDVRSAGAFSINTGRALLVDYDYAFDAVAGTVGFHRMVP